MPFQNRTGDRMKIRGSSRKDGATPARVGVTLLAAALAGVGMGGSGAGAALSGQCGPIAAAVAPTSVVPDALQDDAKMALVTEARERTLTSDLPVDLNLAGLYDDLATLPVQKPVIPAGTSVSSFLIHSDPIVESQPGQRLTTTVNFTSDILGVMVADTTLSSAADAALGATGVTYRATAARGLELNVDWVRLSARSIQVSVRTSTAVDEVRVITAGAGDLAGKASGYQMVASDGGVFSFGNRVFHGSTGAQALNSPIVAAASPCTGGGYWLAAADGGIFAFDAPFLGSMGGTKLNKPIVAMAGTLSGKGYWMVASDGGIFNFGDAAFKGSTGAINLTQPIVGIASTPTGNGYWLVASDGGIFSFGDAVFQGSTGATKLAKPIVGMASTPTGKGYWLVASDGGIFSFGDAKFYGSTGAITLNQPIVDMVVTPSGAGYWLVASDGGIFAYGDAANAFYGSTGAINLTKPIVAAL
jgi:hypothetical protein